MKLGYVPGEWNETYLYNSIVTERKLRLLHKKGKTGTFLFNNIRYQYKFMKDVQDVESINLGIDYAFYTLKSLNRLTYNFLNQPYKADNFLSSR